jgi:murein DD-endopeptidase MepM/ murein hydrolase activator NlpD
MEQVMKSAFRNIMIFLLFLVSIGIIAYVITTSLGGKIPGLASSQSKEAVLPTTTVETTYDKTQLLNEIQPFVDLAITNHKEEVLAYMMYTIEIDHIDLNESHNLALVWLAMRDPSSGMLVPSEPGLAIAEMEGSGLWNITLQSDATWNTVLGTVPEEMLTPERKLQYTVGGEQSMGHDAAPLTGYKLPWQGGEGKYITGSIGHVYIYRSCVSSCLYAFDFADGTMFPVLAAKAGTVKYAVWGYENGNTDNANYIVLEDTTTSPVSYMVYMHLAKDSIPEALRTTGAAVQQGDLIGIADDTGYSTGHHLHFHVHTNASSYWGTSVDIRFDDVTINDGRPRTCVEAQYYPDFGAECQNDNLFISGNYADSSAPSGSISSPAAYSTLTENSAALHITLQDDSGIKSAELWVSQLDTWQKYADLPAATSIDTTLDLCSSSLQSGPFSVGLVLEDNAGNKTEEPVGITHFINNSACGSAAVTTCTPAAGQIALFTEKQFGGACQLVESGLYNEASFLPAEWPGTQSIRLGADTQAVIFSGTYAGGRMESLLADDPDDQNNRVPFNAIQSMKVQALSVRSDPVPQTPAINGVDADNLDSLTLTWGGGEGSNTYTHTLSGPNGYSTSTSHSSLPYWSVGSLPAGEYLWTMQAEQNQAAGVTASLAFTIPNTSLPAQTSRSAPYTEDWADMSADDWFTSGNWQLGSLKIGDWSGSAWIFGSGSSYTGSGDLTSPPISIPESGYGLLFSSFSDIENTAGVFDRREVQISVNGSNFIPLYTLQAESEQRVWKNSPVFDLSAYAGQSVRLRFHFDAIDSIDNQHLGWVIRSVRVEKFGTTCGAGSSQSTPIAYGQLINGTLCSAAEIHTYQINLAQDQSIVVKLNAQNSNNGSLLLNVLDANGNPLASQQSTGFAFKAAQAGTVQLQLLSSRYPDGLSGATPYQLQLTSDTIQPTVSFKTPVDGVITDGDSFTVEASVADDQSIQAVNLYWHPADWAGGTWQKIGSDINSTDGWEISFAQASISPIPGSALWLEAVDSAGNSGNAVLWNLRSDDSPPETNLLALPEYQESTLIPLVWQVTFGKDKVASYEIIYRENGGIWQTLSDSLPAESTRTVFVGEGGSTYDFNLRAHDQYGNIESWLDAETVSTTIVSACTRDAYETETGDDTWQSATASALNTAETHNICEEGDTDWYALSKDNGKYQQMVLTPQNPINGLIVTVYDSTSMEVLQQETSYGTDDPITISWTFGDTENIVVQVEPADGNVWGTQTQYEWLVQKPLSVNQIGWVCGGAFLPAALVLLFKKKKTT